jgi:hypothetical protein
MFCEVFRRLIEFGRLDSYRYIGFGSTFFTDFSLFHKSLGISNCVSIEREEEDKDRFEFNKPYKCINIVFGESNSVLPQLPWDARTIIWLDYDYKLNQGVLTDIAFVCSEAISGSVIIVTVDAKPLEDIDQRLEELKSRVGDEKIPHELHEPETSGVLLADWGTADFSRQIISNEINSIINTRNGLRQPGSKFLYRQLFNFHYADGAKMLTVGGIIYDEGQSHLLAKCGFDQLEFVKTCEEPYTIEVPNLTIREIHHLDKQLPSENLSGIDSRSIPERDIRTYAKVYRYFPAFVEAEIG